MIYLNDRFDKIASEIENDIHSGKKLTREDAVFLKGIVHPNCPLDDEAKETARRLLKYFPKGYFRKPKGAGK